MGSVKLLFTITIFLNKIGREISIPLTSMRDKSDWVVSSRPSLVSEGFYFIKKGAVKKPNLLD